MADVDVGLPERPPSRSMPPYYQLPFSAPVKKQRRLHEQKIAIKHADNRAKRKEHLKQLNEDAVILNRKIPIDVLTHEWLNVNVDTVALRTYLLDKCLPTVILGLEQLLVEVEKRGLIDAQRHSKLVKEQREMSKKTPYTINFLDDNNENSDKPIEELSTFSTNFNPINFLARFLMRNNPRYNNSLVMTPYSRGISAVTEQLKKHVFSSQESHLAQIKMSARKKREKREEQEKMAKLEIQRKGKVIEEHFEVWVKKSPNRLIKLAYIQNALRSFRDFSGVFPNELRARSAYKQPLSSTNTDNKTLSQAEFTEHMMGLVSDFPADIFDVFISHMELCAKAYYETLTFEKRRKIFTDLFKILDTNSIGVINRRIVLKLLHHFWYKMSKEKRALFRNPCKWPITDDDQKSQSEESLSLNEFDMEGSDEIDAEEVNSENIEKEESTKGDTGDSNEKQTTVGETHEAKPESKIENAEQKSEPKSEDIAKKEEPKPEDSEDKPELKSKDIINAADETEDKPMDPNVASLSQEKTVAPENISEDNAQNKLDNAEGKLEEENKLDEAEKQSEAEKNVNETEKKLEPQNKTDEDSKEKSTDEEKPSEKLPGEPLSGIIEEQTIDVKEMQHNSDLEDLVEPGMSDTESVKEEASVVDQLRKAEELHQQTERYKAYSREKTSPHNEQQLDNTQFVALIETFIGNKVDDKLLYSFLSFVRDHYFETEEDKLQRINSVNSNARDILSEFLVSDLFDYWDSNGQGYLELDEVLLLSEQYKDGAEKEAVEAGELQFEERMKSLGVVKENMLYKDDFASFIFGMVDKLHGDNQLESLCSYYKEALEKSYEQKMRGLARKKWLSEIVNAADISGGKIENVYKCVFSALFKDAEAHGHNKKISAHINLLEQNSSAPERGDTVLYCVASTPEDASLVLGKRLYPDMKNVSFQAIQSKQPVHVPIVASHGQVHFWNTKKSKDKDGSLVVCPILNFRRHAFGTLNVDTVRNLTKENKVFVEHEISFFQGVAQSFSQAYAIIDSKRKSSRIVESAIYWISKNCPSVKQCVFYLVERGSSDDYGLRKMLSSNAEGEITTHTDTELLGRYDNMFKDYLYKCIDSSEPLIQESYGEFHLAFPIRDEKQFARSLFDLNLGKTFALEPIEKKEIQRMLKIQQEAFLQMARETKFGDDSMLEVEMEMGGGSINILFERIMLMEMRQAVSRIDAEVFAEIKSYHEPPKIVENIVDILIEIFLSQKREQYAHWNDKKLIFSNELLKKLISFDPTTRQELDVIHIREMLKQISKEQLSVQGPFPAEVLYNWLVVTVTLMEQAQLYRSR